ncbi:hypothetical protein [Fimbriiglobus ruber]|uniref:Glycosyltransferase RgtA/B/C/D-like domain-containing protein n=1 Tax=Fimbriiglobus ruber TaxID=1908690 RepID=A0A225EG42_9BACT|nr:hypothetical protein [Fimbriiglobus ruber]OWK47207.1 hypothetical protein FRUB_00906 [Fimbriiglobus ruber]
MTSVTDSASLRRSFYLLLTTVAVAVTVAKIVGAENVYEPSRFASQSETSYGADRPSFEANRPPVRKWPTTRPAPTSMFGSNDRSRWATIRALVDTGTYVVGRRENFKDTQGPFTDTGIIFEDGYQSLDKVMNPETGEYFSSKPPLLPTLLAGEYWVLKKVFGWSIDRDRWWVVCTLLITVNAIPFAVYLVLLARLIETHGATDFGKLFTFTAACFGTFLTTFSVSLNNHTPAACCVLFALYPLLRGGGVPYSLASLFVSGLFAGLTAALDLPALSFTVGLFVPLVLTRPRQALIGFLPGALIPLGGLLACNYAAVGSVLPVYSEFGGPWYNYPGSYWATSHQPGPHKGVDFADEPKAVYAFHLLFGHHGWFSLTPVWLLGAGGLLGLLTASRADIKTVLALKKTSPVWTPRLLGVLAVVVSLVVFAFYVVKTNNYGGNTSGPRWLFWLIPLWLLGTIPAADWVGRFSTGRLGAAVLLGFSVLSVFYPAWNPWRNPWVLQLLEVTGWLVY